MQSARPIIILRFSAMGDVVMAASVLREFTGRYPDVPVVMVSRESFRPFFECIKGIQFHPFLPKGKHKGVTGLRKLFRELRQYQPLAVADLHGNLRSRLLSFFFRLRGIPVAKINKGREEKAALIREKNKVLKPLKQTTERYADVLRSLGYPFTLSHTIKKKPLPLPETAKRYFADTHSLKVGIAPFAQHPYKIYPYPKMEAVIAWLVKTGYAVFIFGGGTEEKAVAEKWQVQFPGVHSLIGTFSLRQELHILSNLDVMLSMDSAGMHMASFTGIRVISVWGPTHPYAGFLGYGQHEDDCIQVVHPARPNSVYGNKPCYCDGVPCMDLIEPGMIIAKFREIDYHG